MEIAESTRLGFTAAVTNISPRGLWLLLGDNGHCREVFLPYEIFPWFDNATLRQILAVERPNEWRLRWDDLDVDLAIDSIDHPELYPLRFQERR